MKLREREKHRVGGGGVFGWRCSSGRGSPGFHPKHGQERDAQCLHLGTVLPVVPDQRKATRPSLGVQNREGSFFFLTQFSRELEVRGLKSGPVCLFRFRGKPWRRAALSQGKASFLGSICASGNLELRTSVFRPLYITLHVRGAGDLGLWVILANPQEDFTVEEAKA